MSLEASTLLATLLTITPAGGCVVPMPLGGSGATSVSEESRESCLRNAHTARTPPRLSVEALRRGPDGPASLPPDEPVYCEFVPYKMHLKGRGKSRKFWCRRTNPAGSYYNDRHELVEAAVAVSAAGVLVDRDGQFLFHADGGPQRPEIIKVKYTNGDNRGREVHTEVAAGRLFWALGFPADRMYAARVWCRGCTADPFKDIRRDSQNHARDESNFFPRASIERRFPGRTVQTREDEGWGWKEAYARLERQPRKRVEFEAYVLAMNLIHFHNGLEKQNTLACEDGHWDASTGACSRPTVYLDDMGASFGGGSARADYRRYLRNTVFKKAGSCEVRADLAGFGRVSEEARLLLARRLEALTGEMVRTIFEVAGFTEENTDASVEQWTRAFLQRIRDVQTRSCAA